MCSKTFVESLLSSRLWSLVFFAGPGKHVPHSLNRSTQDTNYTISSLCITNNDEHDRQVAMLRATEQNYGRDTKFSKLHISIFLSYIES